MEEFHSSWFSKSNILRDPSPKLLDSIHTTQSLEKSKWKGSSDNNIFFPLEHPERPHTYFSNTEDFLAAYKEEENQDDNQNRNSILNPIYQESQYLQNSSLPLGCLFPGNCQRKIEDFRQDYYQIRRSRGISFFSEQEGLDAELARNQELEFIRYFGNQGKQDVSPAKSKVKNEFEIANYIEEENGVMNLCDFHPTNMLRDLTQCFQPRNFENEKASSFDLNQIPQIKESVDDKCSRSLEDSPAKPRKKRKQNPETSAEGFEKAPKLHKTQIEVSKQISSVTKEENFISPENLEKQNNHLRKSQNVSTLNQVSQSPTSQRLSPTEKNEIYSGPNEANDATALFKSRSLDLSTQNVQTKKPEVLGRLFHGFELPAEVEELIGKSKFFSSLQHLTTKKIGTLTAEERQIRVQRYQEKRRGRTWAKKINYDCRKKVAETRLRLKGRFVTRVQAFTMLEEEGIKYNPEEITDAEIKGLLENALDKKRKENGSKKRKERKNKKENRLNVTAEKTLTQTSESERYDIDALSEIDGGNEES